MKISKNKQNMKFHPNTHIFRGRSASDLYLKKKGLPNVLWTNRRRTKTAVYVLMLYNYIRAVISVSPDSTHSQSRVTTSKMGITLRVSNWFSLVHLHLVNTGLATKLFTSCICTNALIFSLLHRHTDALKSQSQLIYLQRTLPSNQPMLMSHQTIEQRSPKILQKTMHKSS